MKISSKFCTILAITGIIGSNVATAIATKKAVEKINGEKLLKKDIFKRTYKDYIAPTAIIIGTIASVTGAEIINAKTQATLTATLLATKKAYDKYSESVKNVFGIEGEKNVKKDYIINSIKNKKDIEKETYWVGYGFDGYFQCDPEKIEMAEYLLNKKLRTNNVASVSDFLDYIGVDYDSALPNYYGWGRNELYGELEDTWLLINTDDFELDNGEIVHAIIFNCHPTEDYESTDKWYEIGGPLDRDVPFDLNPSAEELENYIKE